MFDLTCAIPVNCSLYKCNNLRVKCDGEAFHCICGVEKMIEVSLWQGISNLTKCLGKFLYKLFLVENSLFN